MPTILVIEDEDAVRDMLKATLERNGFRVLAASGGREALDICESEPAAIDLLLTDIVMPGTSGTDLAGYLAVRYGLMQAIGGMLGCRVEPCVATETQVYRTLTAPLDLAGKQEIAFDGIPESRAQSAIALNYILHWGAGNVRITGCGRAIWARLQRPGSRSSECVETLDLLFETPSENPAAA